MKTDPDLAFDPDDYAGIAAACTFERARLDTTYLYNLLGMDKHYGPPPPHMLEFVDHFDAAVIAHQPLNLVAAPGHLKTTAMRLHATKRLLYDDPHILHGTKSPKKSLGTTDWLQHVTNKLYGSEGDLWQAQQFTVPGWDPITEAPSFMSVTTSLKFEGERFNEIKTDDLEDIDSYWSEVIREKTLEWQDLQLKPRVFDGGLSRIGIGSFWHRDDLLNEEIRRGTKTIIYPMFYSPRPDFFNDEAGIPRTNVYWMGDKYSHLWPEKWAGKDPEQFEREVGTFAYKLRYMCDPTKTEGRWFRPGWFSYWQDIVGFETTILPNLQIIVANDPNLKDREIKTSAEAAIQVGGWTYNPDKVYQFESYSGRWDDEEIMNTIDGIYKRWNHVGLRGIEEWIIEASSSSEHYIRNLEAHRTPDGHLLPVTRQPTMGASKESRIVGIAPHINTGRLIMSRDDAKTYNQLIQFPNIKKMDLADCLEMLIRPVLSDTPRRVTELYGFR